MICMYSSHSICLFWYPWPSLIFCSGIGLFVVVPSQLQDGEWNALASFGDDFWYVLKWFYLFNFSFPTVVDCLLICLRSRLLAILECCPLLASQRGMWSISTAWMRLSVLITAFYLCIFLFLSGVDFCLKFRFVGFLHYSALLTSQLRMNSFNCMRRGLQACIGVILWLWFRFSKISL
jgi:hypothetical protein